MNAAARAISEVNFFTGSWFTWRFKKFGYSMMFLVFAILFSACAVIFTCNEYRSSVNSMEEALHIQNQLLREQAELLLERASLRTPKRIEAFAIYRLQMHLPETKKILIQKGL